MAVRIQFRRGTAAEWASANPTLAAGELGYETDTASFKIGDGVSDWDTLAYGAVSESYVNDAISNIVGLSPESLDTLEELAASLGDDPDFVGTINASIDSHVDATTNVHGISDTSLLETTSGAQTKANNAQNNAIAYTDNAIADLISSAPGTLDTLNELAAALGDDPNFATTVTTSLAGKLNFVLDTAANFITANAVTEANTIYIESDTGRSYARLGDGITAYGDLDFIGKDYTDSELSSHSSETQNVHGITDSANLAYLSDVSNVTSNVSAVAGDLSVHVGEYLNVHGIANTQDLVTSSDLSGAIEAHDLETLNVHGIANTADLLTTTDYNDLETLIGEKISYTEAANLYATIADATLTGTVSLPTLTSIGNVTSSEIETLSGVTSSIQDQLDGKLDSSDASNTYALKDNTVLTGDVTLPLGTTIGNVVSLEISYLEGVSSNIQDQLDQKLESSDISTLAPEDSPTFTGTVGLPADTSIGNVTSTEISYLEGVSGGIQSQLDAKLASATAATTYAPIADPSFTGNVSFDSATSMSIPANSDFSFGGLTGFVASSYLADIDRNVKQALDNVWYKTDASIELPYSTSIGNVTSDVIASLEGLDTTNVYATQFNYLAGSTGNIQDQLDAKAPIANAVFTGSTEVVGLVVTGDLTVQGTTTTVGTSNLSIKDNMVYLNQAGIVDLTNAVGDGTNVVYTTATAHGFTVGNFVTIANTTPSSFDYDSTGAEILAVTENTFTIASTVTDTYVSGGTARGKVHANPDLGWAAGRYADNTYAHAGVFRDATDGVFKFFDGYVPEPDESVFIDTSDNTFALAPIEASTVSAADFLPSNAIVFADNTVQTSAGVASITGFTEKTASYQLDTLAHKDNVVEMNSSSAVTFTIPLESTFSWPIGASMDIIQTGSGQVTVDIEAGGTLNYTPGNKLRTQWSSCTIMKRAADSWILYGDLTA